MSGIRVCLNANRGGLTLFRRHLAGARETHSRDLHLQEAAPVLSLHSSYELERVHTQDDAHFGSIFWTDLRRSLRF